MLSKGREKREKKTIDKNDIIDIILLCNVVSYYNGFIRFP